MAINTEKTDPRLPSGPRMNGWLALSPLLVFLLVYLVSSIVARDFYKVPVAAAFIIASAWAMLITRSVDKTDTKISIFSEGAGNRNVLLMIWIFVLAGAFASTARDIGAIDATVNATLHILPGRLVFAGLFLSACFISMAIGTSVGTIVALVPIATGIAQETGVGVPLMTAVIIGGAFFGDNLSFISDTTVAATKSQGCSMQDKFRANLWIAAPAALLVTVLYVVIGWQVEAVPETGAVNWIGLVPYLLVIGLALAGVNVVTVLAVGIGVNGVIGWCTGAYDWVGWMTSIGGGISSMGELIIVSLLAGGMLELIRYNGGLDFIIRGLTRRIRGKRGAELSIAALVSLVNFCTANNTIAIITVGSLARDISERYRLDPRKVASILDTFSCLVQGIIPYGAQMLMASGLAGVSAVSITGYLYYPFALGLLALFSILLRLPRKYSGV
ncbi:MAG: Na+/H+ antiporter NhaC family protein [Bacteroidales bacterium]|nr:Na+/H+ antiporter NhaC family protein [Bacteroidales bacterium]